MLLLLVDRPQIYHIEFSLSLKSAGILGSALESFPLSSQGILPLTPRSIARSLGQLRDGRYIYFKYGYYIYIYTL